jgi:hypothetical protein
MNRQAIQAAIVGLSVTALGVGVGAAAADYYQYRTTGNVFPLSEWLCVYLAVAVLLVIAFELLRRLDKPSTGVKWLFWAAAGIACLPGAAVVLSIMAVLMIVP